ncbi:TRAFs-binding domain-containing protein [Phenylobacterium sp.]|uniref:TRAFs-binding domain-containing protein n=1 Tax=Phenylobacterium sp. TaxID=1871053 RepID=UPI002723772C|nr:TRAFs-binding domain-containing protein [Phenylobacterium sp.]MDO8801191.1 TRAFs-binding domain-containing protein [Phenylobacterium sp.]
MQPSLLTIIAHARSGALDHAWRLFREAGLEDIDDDPAVLSVRGRLLKDRALAAAGAARRGFYAQAALAYRQAGALSGDTYPLINAATLALLGGDEAGAGAGARRVLEVLDAAPDQAETPYWRAATRAEALLVLGDAEAARAALVQAMALAPRAWEDHASTLRQFALILAALGEEAGWLAALRPPRTLHFAGHMALGAESQAVARQAAELLEAERVGFGYGALAAGTDIVIAEALLARGAELHVVLPAAMDLFRAASVVPAGGDWAARFDALIAAAESLRIVGSADDAGHPLAIRLAAEVAMGCAAMRAQALETEAVQMVVVDASADQMGSSGWSVVKWAGSGRRQHALAIPRTPGAAAPPDAGTARLVALLLVDFAETPRTELVETVLPRLAAIGGPPPLAPPTWEGQRFTAAFTGPAEAAAFALDVAAVGARVAGAYGLTRQAADPFGGPGLLLGEVVTIPSQILAATPAGSIQVSDDFAAALHAAGALPGLRTQYVGDLDAADPHQATGIFALSRTASDH